MTVDECDQLIGAGHAALAPEPSEVTGWLKRNHGRGAAAVRESRAAVVVAAQKSVGGCRLKGVRRFDVLHRPGDRQRPVRSSVWMRVWPWGEALAAYILNVKSAENF
jgi:hypothetical protein